MAKTFMPKLSRGTDNTSIKHITIHSLSLKPLEAQITNYPNIQMICQPQPIPIWVSQIKPDPTVGISFASQLECEDKHAEILKHSLFSVRLSLYNISF